MVVTWILIGLLILVLAAVPVAAVLGVLSFSFNSVLPFLGLCKLFKLFKYV